MAKKRAREGPLQGRSVLRKFFFVFYALNDGVVPGGFPRRRSWAACPAVVGVCGLGH